MVDNRDLFARIAVGPVFLLLGQGQQRDGLVDPSGDLSTFPAGVVGALQQSAHDQQVAFRGVPERLEVVTAVPWSGVLTSRIDSSVARWFEASWRRVVSTGSTDAGRHPRSKTELQIRHLFGGLGLPDDEKPPTDEFSMVDGHRRASDMLTLLASSLLTPRGVLLIEDWSTADWLTPTDLYNLATRVGLGQIHLFSASAEIRGNRAIIEAEKRGSLILHDGDLSTLLREAESRGALPTPNGQQEVLGRLIPVADTFVELPVTVWNQVVGSARPVDLSLLHPFPPSSDALRYQQFRNFLSAGEGPPPWQAIASGLKLHRTYEAELLARVEAQLDEGGDHGPIILQGQTATGKSLALAWLAQKIAASGRAVVLHQPRRRDRPTASDLETFNSWVEGATGLRTLLIWDGMLDPDDYFALHRQLRSRGQRVLIVGSSYIAQAAAAHTVTAPIRLDAEEATAARAWLTGHGLVVNDVNAKSDVSFLALLYRSLPETEMGLRRGLAHEMRAAEARMESRARDRRVEPDARMSAIAQALMAAGINLPTFATSQRPDAELIQIDFAERSTAEQLTAMVLTAGRRGQPIPLDLALRVVGRDGSSAVVDFVKEHDIVRWTEDESGNQFIEVRTTLEAELLAREDLSRSAEIEVICAMIRALRPTSSRTGGDEIQFMVDLMDQVGPQARDGSGLSEAFGDFARAFRDQRAAGSFEHHRLALLEANLIREFVMKAQRGGSIEQPERLDLLRQSEDLLQRTLESADTSGRSRLNLFVELASTYGAQVYELTEMGGEASADEIVQLMANVLSAIMQARAIDAENVYPVDVIAWSTTNAVSGGTLSDTERIALLADAKASLDSLDVADLPPKQQAKHALRQADIARLLNDPNLERTYLELLKENDDPAAYYLVAVRAMDSGSEGISVALQSLLLAPQHVREDWKCARLILDLWWQAKTGARLLRSERAGLPLSTDDWEECLDLVNSLTGATVFDGFRISFVRGLAFFHLGRIAASLREFRDLGDRAREVTRRVIAGYLASNPDGTPRQFTGRVAFAYQDGRGGRVWVDQLSAEIDFVPLRFSPEDYRGKNEIVPPFHIAFNYRGPIADPIRHNPRPPRPPRPGK